MFNGNISTINAMSIQHSITSFNIQPHHSTFNHIIQHSTISFNIQPYHSTFNHIIQHSTVSFNIQPYHSKFQSSTQGNTSHHALQTQARDVNKNMADNEDAFSSEFPVFLNALLDTPSQLIDKINLGENQEQVLDEVSMYVELLEETISLLTCFHEIECGTNFEQEWRNLIDVFNEICIEFKNIRRTLNRPSSLHKRHCDVARNHTPGRPKLNVSAEVLEDLRGLGFTWAKIARIFGVSRWTISRRVKEFNLQSYSGFSDMSDNELDGILKECISRHGETTGQTLIMGHLCSLGLRIQRKRVRKSLVRIDPKNSALRMGIVVHRRKYYVPWPNSLWHLDGHHPLIRWGLVIHGCIDGYSRRVIYLKCNNDNLSDTVLALFMEAVKRDNNLWPSRIRVDRGVEDVKVCDAIVEKHGEGRGSFIAGSSTQNQRIERLWRMNSDNNIVIPELELSQDRDSLEARWLLT